MTSLDVSERHGAPGPLGDALKSGTRAWHARAERSGVMAALLDRSIRPPAYVALLFNLLSLYETLESVMAGLPLALGRAEDWMPAPRSAALRHDLQSLETLGWHAPPVVEAATATYIQRLQAMSVSAPHRLIGHAYARSLGDLHGGQILLRIVRECPHLPAGCSTRFYELGDVQLIAEQRMRFRAQMHALTLSADQAADVLDEACWSFEQHCQLFDQIQSRHA
jgi:heme oxygenase (biliverdin-producing, ferredoxin)